MTRTSIRRGVPLGPTLAVGVKAIIPHTRHTLRTTSLVENTIPMSVLWVTLHLIRAGLPLYPTAEAFVTGTLLGGVSGIPLGTGVTGSLTAVRLIAGGAAPDLVPLAVAVMHLGESKQRSNLQRTKGLKKWVTKARRIRKRS